MLLSIAKRISTHRNLPSPRKFHPGVPHDHNVQTVEPSEMLHGDQRPISNPESLLGLLPLRKALGRSPSSNKATDDRIWILEAISKLNSDLTRSSDTHLLKLSNTNILHSNNIHFYLKDESTHPTGSLKHRLGRSLFMYGLCNGWIKQNTTIIEASSGSTAVSEAYFADVLGLRFVAVMPKTTSQSKIDLIRFHHGDIHFVDKASDVYTASKELAEKEGGHFMNQFEFAERATDWKGFDNIASSLFKQLENEEFPVPEWVVASAGTGGTSATISRWAKYRCLNTRICVPDPENSVFYDYFHTADPNITSSVPGRIEGIGRPRVEPSFLRSAIDRMLFVPDNYSVAAMRLLEPILGKKVGPSTGTNFYAMLLLSSEMIAEKRSGSIAGILCDSGERYLNTYYDDAWLKENNFDIIEATAQIKQYLKTGEKLPFFEKTYGSS